MMWKSKTGEQTAEDWETISQGTHFRIGVVATKGDVKLRNQFEKKMFFYTFYIQAVCFKFGKGVLWVMFKGNWISYRHCRVNYFELN